MKVNRLCKICHKSFSVEKSEVNRGGGKYCSKECSNIGIRGLRTSIFKKCLVCGKEFKVFQSELKKGLGKFCSQKCHGKYQRGRDKKKKGKNILCLYCKKEFYIFPSQIKRGQKYCSRTCFNKSRKGQKFEWLRRDFNKENNPNWKGGITKLQLKIRNSDKYKDWRDKVFKRDNYICQLCNQVGGELNAHHKIHFAYILKNNNINTILEAEECNKLWDISNGITLCKDCHKTQPY